MLSQIAEIFEHLEKFLIRTSFDRTRGFFYCGYGPEYGGYGTTKIRLTFRPRIASMDAQISVR